MVRAFGTVPLAVVFLLVTGWGCSQPAELVSDNAEAIDFPPSFAQDGETWTKQPEMSEAEVERLSNYFRHNPSVAENAIVEGAPVVYAAARNARRYYWSAAAIDGAEWLCIEIGRGPVQLTDGRGNPFNEGSGRDEKQ